MAEQEVPQELQRLVEKIHSEYLDSEVAIADALANADDPLDIDALVEATGYTERTVKKRVESLIDRFGGEPLIFERDDGTYELHPRVGLALRSVE